MHVICCRAECSILNVNTIFDNVFIGVSHGISVGFGPWNPCRIVPWNPCGLVPWNPYGLFHGIQGGYASIPYGINHSMTIP